MFHLTEPSSAGKALRFRPQVNRLEDRSLPGSALDLFSPAAALGGISLSLLDPVLGNSSAVGARPALMAASPTPGASVAANVGGTETGNLSGSTASTAGTGLLLPAASSGMADAGWLNSIPVNLPGRGTGPSSPGSGIESPFNGPFDSFALPPCDDCSSSAVPLGFTFNFFGVQRSTVWVNNNGNLTFDGAFSDFDPGPLTGVSQPILAPFWADVYTADPGTGRVTYGPGTLDGDPAFGATWENVAHFLPDATRDIFQVVIVDHSARLGYQEVQFNYGSIQWDRTDSSNDGPRVGYSNNARTSGEAPGSGTFNNLVDGGAQSLQVLRRYTVIVYPG